MINTIILDLDGPLLDGIDRHHACYCSILADLGCPPIDRDEYWRGKRNRMNRRDLLKQSGAEQHYDAFLSEWLLRIESPEMLAKDRLQPEVLPILSEWRSAGIRLILATMRNN